MSYTKTSKLLFTKIKKTNILFSYYETTLSNSLPDSTGGATSLSALPFKKSFLLFMY